MRQVAMDGKGRPGSGGPWQDGVVPMVVAVALSLAVAAVVDVINAHSGASPGGGDAVARPAVRNASGQRPAGPAVPRYVVAVRRPGSAIAVRDVMTGADAGPAVAAPAGQRFQQVAAAGHGAFVLSAQQGGGQIAFYRLTLGPDGRARQLAPIPGTTLRGASGGPSDLAVSGDRIAYLSGGRRIDVLSSRTGDARRWTTRSGRLSSLSWAGSTLSFVLTSGRRDRQVRVLDTTGPGGGDLKATRAVLRMPAGGTAAVLSGDAVLVGVRAGEGLSVQEFSSATGRRTKVLWTYQGEEPGELSRDPAGGYVLALGKDGLVFADPVRGVRELRADDVSDAAW